MHKPWLLTTALTLSAFAASATAQEPPKPAAELLCSEIQTVEEAHAAALVYYIAGFVDGQQAASGTAITGDPATVGGITLSAAAVLEACAASPDMLVAEAIAAQGGSTGAAPAPAATAEETAPTGDSATPPAESEAAPADDGAAEGTTTPQ